MPLYLQIAEERVEMLETETRQREQAYTERLVSLIGNGHLK